MKTVANFVDEYFEQLGNGKLTEEQQLEKTLRAQAEEVRKQVIAVINEARQEGEWDIRSVRTRIERMKIE